MSPMRSSFIYFALVSVLISLWYVLPIAVRLGAYR